jgi:hypothetical protein
MQKVPILLPLEAFPCPAIPLYLSRLIATSGGGGDSGGGGLLL